MAILAIAFLVICAICAIRESKVTGTFKTFGVYGRVAAYLGLFAPIGLGMFVAGLFAPDLAEQRWVCLIVGLFGVLVYAITYLKCPAFLKHKVIPCMLLSGLGVCIKICLFFIGAVWKLSGPHELHDTDGNTVYVYGGEVYNKHGKHIGTANADRTAYTPNP